jgi:hypothetical protein
VPGHPRRALAHGPVGRPRWYLVVHGTWRGI